MNKSKLWWGVLIVLIVGGVGLLLAGKSQEAGDLPALTNDDWVIGEEAAPITLIEYSDFQCPACAAFEPFLKQLLKEFPDRVQFVYRHFPLTRIHGNAEAAALAAEAAGQQDKFWEMHDLIFMRQQIWESSPGAAAVFRGYAGELGLDIEQYDADLEAVAAKVEDDLQGGLRAGVEGTPTFFLNGEKVSNPRSYDDFARIIREAE